MAVALLLAGCGGADAEPVASPTASASSASPSPSPPPALGEEELAALLLQPEDLPEIPVYERFLTPVVEPPAEPTPFLCGDPLPLPLSRGTADLRSEPVTEVQRGPYLLQTLSVWPDEQAAQAAQDAVREAVTACARWTDAEGVERTTELLGDVPVPAPAQAFRYRQAQVGADSDGWITTQVRVGRTTFFLNSFGGSRDQVDEAALQSQAADRAVARVLAAAP